MNVNRCDNNTNFKGEVILIKRGFGAFVEIPHNTFIPQAKKIDIDAFTKDMPEDVANNFKNVFNKIGRLIKDTKTNVWMEG